MITTFSVKPQGGGTFYSDRKETPAGDLRAGQQLTLWVPESRMEVKVLPVPTAESWRVIEPAPK
jgi:hypothetical protein